MTIYNIVPFPVHRHSLFQLQVLLSTPTVTHKLLEGGFATMSEIAINRMKQCPSHIAEA